MRILVTGGAGFIGTNLIKRLLEEGHKVHSLDDYSTGSKKNHQRGCKYIVGKVEEKRSQSNLHQNYDLIYHLAGLSRIQPSFNNPTATFLANTVGTQEMCEFARTTNAKLVYAGSSSKHHDPYQSPYAAYKYLGEEVCKMYRKTYGIDIEIVRFYNVYGPYEIIDGKWAALIGKWIGQIKEGKPLTIVGDGSQKRDFTHIIDIVDGLIKIAFSKQTQEDAWELGSGKNYSINEVFEMFQRKFDVSAKFIENQKGNYKETLRESNEAIDLLDWNPQDRLQNYILNLKND